MNFLAILMVVTLSLIIITSLDPRVSTSQEIKAALFRLTAGVILGFIIMLLYGLGVPGLKYFFIFIGVGGIAHLFLTRKTPVIEPDPTQSLSFNS